MEIATTFETVRIATYTLTLTEAELTAALVDPVPLQDALRSARGEQARGRHGKRNITIGRKGKKERTPKASPKATSTKTGAFTKEPCAKCGRLIAQSQMNNHLRGCPGVAAAGSD